MAIRLGTLPGVPMVSRERTPPAMAITITRLVFCVGCSERDSCRAAAAGPAKVPAPARAPPARAAPLRNVRRSRCPMALIGVVLGAGDKRVDHQGGAAGGAVHGPREDGELLLAGGAPQEPRE